MTTRASALLFLASLSAAACSAQPPAPPSASEPGPTGGGAAPGGTSSGGSPGAPSGPEAEPVRPEEAKAPPCIDATAAARDREERIRDGRGEASLRVASGDGCQRTYRLATTQPLREGLPGNPRTVAERSDGPAVRSGNVAFDALYALALEETRSGSVESIRDGAFANGAPLTCAPGGCFRTGRLWTYVWTRDTAYAAHLGLGALDPTRMRNSLEFKLSPPRGGGGLEVVQDTGTGGSYPISTDRVVWALGAERQLSFLPAAESAAFAGRTLEALRGTLERDRRVAFDEGDGLYRGETSFLDWREQTYPAYTAQDTTAIGSSKALSTNVGHYAALRLAARLARPSDASVADRYDGWAEALKQRINTRFFVEEAGLFSSYTGPAFDEAPFRKYDALGIALAILTGVVDGERGRTALARYPHHPAGLPVVWPQERRVPGYHNRGIWPFVSAYWVKAARAVGNEAVAAFDILSLVNLAALSLSHMENAELLTGLPSLNAPGGLEPVVNSHEQLWSVAGYIAIVHDVLFGLETEGDALRFVPFVPKSLRAKLFPASERLVLHRLPFRGKRVTVELVFPAGDGAAGGVYSVDRVRWNGVPRGTAFVPVKDMADDAYVKIELGAGTGAEAPPVVVVAPGDAARTYAPTMPALASVTAAGARVSLAWSPTGDRADELEYRVYKNGRAVATVPGTATTWQDAEGSTGEGRTPCYTLEAVHRASGTTSLRSRPSCYWAAGRIAVFGADQLARVGGRVTAGAGRSHLEDWGDAGHNVTAEYTPAQSGAYLVQMQGANGAGSINTGITCSVKYVRVEELATGKLAGEGYLAIPHGPSWTTFLDSAPVEVRLTAGTRYRIRVGDGPFASNMSALDHFRTYTGGMGGTAGPFGRVNLSEVKVLAKDLTP